MISIKQLSATAIIGTAVVLTAAAPALACQKQDVKPASHKVGICHATGSSTNPYVFISVDEHAAQAHKNHQDGRDIIGARSAKDCPKPVATKPEQPKGVTPKGGNGNGQVLGSRTTAPVAQTLPTELPKTGAEAGLSALIGIPAMALTGRAYLHSRKSR